jgi:hypothetical protein
MPALRLARVMFCARERIERALGARLDSAVNQASSHAVNLE